MKSIFAYTATELMSKGHSWANMSKAKKAKWHDNKDKEWRKFVKSSKSFSKKLNLI